MHAYTGHAHKHAKIVLCTQAHLHIRTYTLKNASQENMHMVPLYICVGFYAPVFPFSSVHAVRASATILPPFSTNLASAAETEEFKAKANGTKTKSKSMLLLLMTSSTCRNSTGTFNAHSAS